jgi:low temperature requirement protein LtrA
MVSRDAAETHRASTPLELFFDLCFVVAIAAAAARLHHAEAGVAGVEEPHLVAGVLGYTMVFFAIWWAWMNVTWFASAFDTDDVLYRLAVFAIIVGALVLAAGVPRAFDARDFGVVTLGYTIMRVPLIGLWLRVAHDDVARRPTALRFVVGLTLCQVGWIALLLAPASVALIGFVVLVAAELTVPVVAESAGGTPWHPGHIAERYGLFTIIVLGESVLSGSVALGAVLDSDDDIADVWGIAVGGLLLLFTMWWKYFARSAEELLTSSRVAFQWGYGHLLVFGSAAAVGAGIVVAVDQATGHSAISSRAAAAAVTVPVALYLVTVWALHLRRDGDDRTHGVLLGASVVGVLLSTFAPQPVLTAGLVSAAMVAVAVLLDVRSARDEADQGRSR